MVNALFLFLFGLLGFYCQWASLMWLRQIQNMTKKDADLLQQEGRSPVDGWFGLLGLAVLIVAAACPVVALMNHVGNPLFAWGALLLTGYEICSGVATGVQIQKSEEASFTYPQMTWVSWVTTLPSVLPFVYLFYVAGVIGFAR